VKSPYAANLCPLSGRVELPGFGKDFGESVSGTWGILNWRKVVNFQLAMTAEAAKSRFHDLRWVALRRPCVVPPPERRAERPRLAADAVRIPVVSLAASSVGVGKRPLPRDIILQRLPLRAEASNTSEP